MSDFDEDDPLDDLPLNIPAYFDDRMWQTETNRKRVADMTAEEVAFFVRTLAPQLKRAPLINKIAGVISSEDMDGGLLLAADDRYLADHVLGIVGKRERPCVAKNCSAVLMRLRDLDNLPRGGYWERLERGSDEETRLCRQYRDSVIGEFLRSALTPLPREAIMYSVVDWLEEGSVQEANEHVTKRSGHLSQQFKVVSVSLAVDSDTVRSNLVYAKGDSGWWNLLASVDFARHGSAEPGHWHLNRSPNEQTIEHYAFKGEVWHGSPENCPLWWMLIPAGKQYHMTPDRVAKLQMAVDDSDDE